jgi:hypothetical protein
MKEAGLKRGQSGLSPLSLLRMQEGSLFLPAQNRKSFSSEDIESTLEYHGDKIEGCSRRVLFQFGYNQEKIEELLASNYEGERVAI